MPRLRITDYDWVSKKFERVGGTEVVADVLSRLMEGHPYRCAQDGTRCYFIDHYRGTRCPVGYLIHSTVYKKWGAEIEGACVYDDQVQAAIKESIGFVPNVDMLYDLQQIHDNNLPYKWPELIAEFRTKWVDG